MYKICLCDDSPDIREEYRQKILHFGQKNGIDLGIRCFYSAEELLFFMDAHSFEIDLLLLDVQLPKLDGISAARQLRLDNCPAEIIFLSSYPQYVFDAFSAHPNNFLLKDRCTPEEFESTLLQALEFCREKDAHVLTIQSKSHLVKLRIRDISYIDVQEGRLTVHYQRECFTFSGDLTTLSRQPSLKEFIRISRFYLVNPSHICHIQDRQAVFYSGQALPIGRTYLKKVKEQFHRYCLSCCQESCRLAAPER